METHPFGALHGGTLNLDEWQERYEKIAEELKKVDAQELEKAKREVGVEDDDEERADDGQDDETAKVKKEKEDGDEEDDEAQNESTPKPKKKSRQSQLDLSAIQFEQASLDPNLITKLRLTKKYYSDALRFINQLESAIPILCQLLVSTTKTEVLESMRFFRIAYEYDIASAEQGIKTMLHLIWTKDNNATAGEEGEGKGIRGSVIECYRSLYFDVVPDLPPKQQVNRITKNMIE